MAEAEDAPDSEAGRPLAALTLEEIYEQYFSFVWRNLRRLGVAERSLRDAAQEVFIVVHRRLPAFEGRSPLRSWLYGIVVRVASDQRRASRRKGFVSAEEPDALAASTRDDPQRRLEAMQAMRLLDALCAELDESKREVFVLAELEGMSVPEIASAIGANANTVYSRLRAARLEFERALARRRAAERRPP